MSTMLKNLVFIICFFSFFTAEAQISNPNPGAYGTESNRIIVDSTLMIPTICGTPSSSSYLKIAAQYQKKSAIIYDSCGHKFYVWDGNTSTWTALLTSSGANPTLAAVTAAGNTTSNSITVNGLTVTGGGTANNMTIAGNGNIAGLLTVGTQLNTPSVNTTAIAAAGGVVFNSTVQTPTIPNIAPTSTGYVVGFSFTNGSLYYMPITSLAGIISGSSPTLNSVTATGNTTSNSITVGGIVNNGTQNIVGKLTTNSTVNMVGLSNTATGFVLAYSPAAGTLTYTAASSGGGITPTIAQVTTQGNTTTNSVTFGGLTSTALVAASAGLSVTGNITGTANISSLSGTFNQVRVNGGSGTAPVEVIGTPVAAGEAFTSQNFSTSQLAYWKLKTSAGTWVGSWVIDNGATMYLQTVTTANFLLQTNSGSGAVLGLSGGANAVEINNGGTFANTHNFKVNGTTNFTGASTFGNTVNITGLTTVAGMSNTAGQTIAGTLGVTGLTTASGGLSTTTITGTTETVTSFTSTTANIIGQLTASAAIKMTALSNTSTGMLLSYSPATGLVTYTPAAGVSTFAAVTALQGNVSTFSITVAGLTSTALINANAGLSATTVTASGAATIASIVTAAGFIQTTTTTLNVFLASSTIGQSADQSTGTSGVLTINGGLQLNAYGGSGANAIYFNQPHQDQFLYSQFVNTDSRKGVKWYSGTYGWDVHAGGSTTLGAVTEGVAVLIHQVYGASGAAKEFWYDAGAAANAFLIDYGAAKITSYYPLLVNNSITTSNPTGGTAQPWKFGSAITTSGLTLKTTQYIELDVNGTLVKLAVVN